MLLAVLLSGFAIMPDIAWGACGDYLTVAGRQMDSHGTVAANDAASQIPSHIGLPSSSKPCRGPNCDRKPVQPVMPQGVPIGLQIDDLALINIASLQTQDDVVNFWWRDSLALKPNPVEEIFHPPRG